jgi:hypothetical protein
VKASTAKRTTRATKSKPTAATKGKPAAKAKAKAKPAARLKASAAAKAKAKAAAKATAKAKPAAQPKASAAAKAKASAAAKPKASAAAKAKAQPAAKATAKPAAKATANAKTAAKPKATARPAPTTTKAPVARSKTDLALGTPEAAPRVHGPRADFGAPADSFYGKQPAPIRIILEELRGLIESEVPEARATLKWGMPVYAIDGTSMVSLAAHKSHVNLILWGSPEAYSDPAGLLSGGGKMGRHLKITALDELPRNAIRGWLETAAARARARA